MAERKSTVIIGAGASGISVARALRKSGHNDVVILEKEATAGGKCTSLSYGGRTYELGPSWITPAYRRVRELMEEHDVPSRLRANAHFIDGSGRISRRPLVPRSMKTSDLLRLPGMALRVARHEVRRQLARFPRLDLVPTDWYQSCEHWARQQDVEPLLDLVRPWAMSSGLGFLDEIPAVYMISYLCLAGPTYELHETGMGGLWQRVAQGYDVRCDTEVRSVKRDAAGVTIETSRGVFEADEVVIACPLENAARFLDAGAEERSLFGEVRTVDHQVIVANTRNMPKASQLFNQPSLWREHAGKPVSLVRRHADTGVITFSSIRGEDGLDAAEREVIGLVERLGGRVTEIIARRSHRSFCHVSSEGLGRNFYRRMEALQGVNRTFYAGEVMSFASVEAVVAYADQLAPRMTTISRVRPAMLPSPGVANDTKAAVRVRVA